MPDTPLVAPHAAPAARGFARWRAGAVWPLLVAALAAAAFIGMDTVIKLLSARYGTWQLSFFRFAGGSVYALALWCWHGRRGPAPGSWPVHLLRCLLLMGSLTGYFFALGRLPLALAVTISYLSPIFVAALAGPLLGERPAPTVWAALACGLAGVLVSAWPELAAERDVASAHRVAGMLSAAVAALAFAGVMLLARHQASREPLWTILAVQSAVPMLLLAGPAALHWQPMPPSDIAWVLLVGALGTTGLVGITYAFTQLEASRVASIDYTGFVWAALLGYLLFGEVPTATTAASAALIIGGCLLLLRR